MTRYAKLAKANSMSLTELSLRWCRQRDAVTTTLLGHTSLAQLEEDLGHFRQAAAPAPPAPAPPAPAPPVRSRRCSRMYVVEAVPVTVGSRRCSRM